MGLDRNSAAQPIRASPAAASVMPAAMASPEVAATARPGSPAAMSATSDPDSTETVDTGPTNRCGEEPNTA